MRPLLTLILILASTPLFAQTVNIPMALRQENWRGSEGEGSCVHASMVNLLRWQGQFALANWWKANYENGEWAERLAERLTRSGVRFADTTAGNPEFLDWALKTRRGCNVVVMGGAHMVTLVHFDSRYAGILDNNYPDKITYYKRDEFVKYWQRSGGWAVTPMYVPSPPMPRR